MPDVTVKALDSFVHHPFSVDKGQKITLPEGIAHDLSKAGLVDYKREKAAPRTEKAEPEAENKADTGYKNKAAAKPANK